MAFSRYSFFPTRFGGKGGNNLQRSSERHAQEIAYLCRKGQGYIQAVEEKGTVRLVSKVRR